MCNPRNEKINPSQGPFPVTDLSQKRHKNLSFSKLFKLNKFHVIDINTQGPGAKQQGPEYLCQNDIISENQTTNLEIRKFYVIFT